MAKMKLYNKNSENMKKDRIIVTSEYVSNSYYCIEKNYFLKYCSIDKKIDAIIETKNGNFMFEHNTFIDSDFSDKLKEWFSKGKEVSDIVNITKIDIENLRLCICAGKVVFIDKYLIDFVETFEKVTYKDGIFYCYCNGEIVFLFTEADHRIVGKREYSETFAVLSEFLKGMIPNVILK